MQVNKMLGRRLRRKKFFREDDMRLHRMLVLASSSLVFLLICCTNNKYKFIEKSDNGIIFLDNVKGRVIFINRSNRVSDFVNLSLSDSEIARITTKKEQDDASQKLKDWGEQDIAGTKYSIALKTRYYKDRLLYICTLTPYSDTMKQNIDTIKIEFLDAAGFQLESVKPKTWARLVDDNGKGVGFQYSGELPMTLDNYLEIDGWSIQWSF
jgi:hypothetical protein